MQKFMVKYLLQRGGFVKMKKLDNEISSIENSKIYTSEALYEMLNNYKGILTSPIIDYLNSLIELDFSVIRDYIDSNDRMALSELEVYKRIAVYNIYNRALSIFKQNGNNLYISGKDFDSLQIYAKLESGKMFELFRFDYQESPTYFQNKIPSGYKTMKIGDITLFQTLESQELREAELLRVMEKLDSLYDEENPYTSHPGAFGGPASHWILEHSEEIRKYEKKFKQLDSKNELSDEEKMEIEITKQFNNLLLEDYGLTDKSFEEENRQPLSFTREETSELKKTLIKKMPSITIKNNIKYI